MKATVYTIDNQPTAPAEVGAWIRIRKIDGAWVCDYENSVGGVVGYRFNTKKAAVRYSNTLSVLRQEQHDAKMAAVRQSNTPSVLRQEQHDAKILNQAQAQAAYSAMVSLNNVGAICGDLTLAEGLRVQWLERVTVRDGLSGPLEEYTNQSEFATAYGLATDA
jgi:hypothetical protein